MKQDQINDYIKSLTNDQLKNKAEEAYQDLLKAAQEQKNSPWHESCFSAVVLYCEEMGKRGLVREKKHEESFADRFLKNLIESASEPTIGLKEGHQSNFRITK